MCSSDLGYILSKRDPDVYNRVPNQRDAWPTEVKLDTNMWDELKKVKVPMLCVKALRSDVGHTEEQFRRMDQEFSHVARLDVDCGHNVAGGAPDALVAGTLKFFADKGI